MAWHGALTPEALWRGRGDSLARVWVIVAAYLIGAVCCLCAWWHESAAATRLSGSPVWIASAIVLILLALDRKLDFLAWVVARCRKLARNQGWYLTHRRLIQKIGTLLIVLVGLGLVTAFWICWGGMAPRYRVACSASAFLACLIVLRAISLHEIDRLLYRKRGFLFGLPINLIIEPIAILILAGAAIAGCCQ